VQRTGRRLKAALDTKKIIMLKKNRKLIVVTIFATLLITFFLFNSQKTKNTHIAEINKQLTENTKSRPLPAPLSGTLPQKQVNLKTKSSALKPTLTQKTLEPLRASFKRVHRSQNLSSLPKEKKILLSNRVIAVPDTKSLPKALSQSQRLTTRETIPYIVHFGRPITAEMQQNLKSAGALLRGYLPNYAFLTELSASSLQNLSNNPDIGYITEFLPEYKIQPFLGSLNKTQVATETVQLSIQTLDPQDTTAVASLISKMGGSVDNVMQLPEWGVINATLALSEIANLSQQGEVQWIEEFVPVKMLNDFAAQTSHLNATTAQNEWFLTGKDQVVGHADTGLDTGDDSTVLPDFKGQVIAYFDLANGGSDAADYNGHGTHTAGSICGNGASSEGLYKGIAYEAKLVTQCIADKDSGSFTGLSDLYSMYAQSYLSGASIHSDSWGSSVYGEYDSFSRTTDLFAWSQPDFLPVFAAGNSGTDNNDNGIVDLDSITSPGTAKNVLTVGASESDRPIANEGFRDRKYYNKWPSSFGANPIKDDYISLSATTSPYLQGMAAYSSRGPTDDNRIKPEVSAPGTDIISTRSTISGAGWLWGILPSNNSYCYSGGTSMSTPLTAGSAALIRQYLVERAHMPKPSSALIKAVMIGGASTLAPGQYGTGTAQEIPFTSPNNVEGWGQPDIVQSIHPSGLMIKLIDDISPNTGETNTYQITVEKSGYPLNIVMSWLDYPGTAGSAVSLINDINLNIITPGTNTLFPNNGTVNDDRNTVESILINSASAGIYTIKVIGHNVLVSGGATAIYMRGAINETPVIVHDNIPYYDSTEAPYPIDFKVQSFNMLTNNELSVFYNTGTATALTGDWQCVSASWVNNVDYRAMIPKYPKNTILHYYIQLTNDLFNVTLPQNATSESQFYSFALGTPTPLIIKGSPTESGVVTPEYGTNSVLSGQSFTATAFPESISDTERVACSGWAGSGDIPLTGSTNSITTSIDQESSLTWNWETQYTLIREMYFEDVDTSFDDGSEWHWKDRVVADQSTYDLLTLTLDNDSGQLYAFFGWSLDESRWPDPTSPSLNPLSGLVMESPHSLKANYMLFSTDADGDGLYDWWERLYFGGTNSTNEAVDDSDGDLWTNIAESMDNTNPHDAASAPTPPTITVNALNPFQSEHPPWTVSAQIEDNFILIEAIMEWREKGETAWNRTAMSYLGDGLFSAQLNPPSHGSKRLDYRVYASDLIGYNAPSFASISPVYSVIGDFNDPWMQVLPDSLGLEELSTQPTNFQVTVENLAGTDLIWTGILVSASELFDTAHPGWQHSGTNDSWTVSTNRSWNGESVWYCGDDKQHQYPNSCHASLDTPSFIPGEHDVLVFRQWINFEEDPEPNYYWDGAVIMISTNNGSTFTIIEPESGYNAFIVPNDASPFEADQPCFGGDGEGWGNVLVNLAPYAGCEVRIRFEFGSDGYVTDEGWYVGGVTLLTSEKSTPPWFTATGSWSSLLADQWQDKLSFEINPLLMQTNSEHVICLRFDSNDPVADPIVDLTIRRGFDISSTTSGNGHVIIDDPIIFRDETATVAIEADYGSYITNVTINGILQNGDYAFKDTRRLYTFHPVTNKIDLFIGFDLRTWTLSIKSELGTPTPATGIYPLIHGTNMSASIVTPIADSNPMIRYSANTYRLIGADAITEESGKITFMVTNNTSLTWLWTTNYQMQASSLGYGVVVPERQWYAAGTYSCTTGYPSSFYHFSQWLGDIEGAYFSGFNGNIIEMPMDAPRYIEASFEISLTSTHAVPEYWLAYYGFTGNFDAAAEGDQDNDKMETWKEWLSDTDPTNPLSLLQLHSLQISPLTVEACWIGGIQRTQQLQIASTPAGPWVSIYTNLPPTALTNSIQLPFSGSNRFFRVLVP
jgi:subtilisin family serine protease